MKLRIKGEVIQKKMTAKGNVMLALKGTNRDYNVVIPKQRKNGFELAKNIKEGETVKVTGSKKIGIIVCDRIEKASNKELKEKQTKLAVYD